MKDAYHPRTGVQLNGFETIDFGKINKDVRDFLRFSDEKRVLTDKIVGIIEPTSHLSILDVGCGLGHVIRKIHRGVKRCVALDPDQEMLDILRKHVRSNSVSFVNKTLEDFEPTQKFDITLSSHTLSYFKDKQRAVAKMLYCTKGDGKLIIVLHCQASEQLQMLEEIHFLLTRREINHIYAEALYAYLVSHGFKPKLEKLETVALVPSLEIALGLSYFLFRIHYAKASRENKRSIRAYLVRKGRDHHVGVRTIHGIITVSPIGNALL